MHYDASWVPGTELPAHPLRTTRYAPYLPTKPEAAPRPKVATKVCLWLKIAMWSMYAPELGWHTHWIIATYDPAFPDHWQYLEDDSDHGYWDTEDDNLIVAVGPEITNPDGGKLV